MEKLPQSISKQFGCVKLYLDDLEKMVNVFANASIEYEVKTDHFLYANLQELCEKERKINSINIISRKPYVSVRFDEKNSFLYADQDDLVSVGLFHSLDNLIKRRKKYAYVSYIFIGLAISTLIIGYFIQKKWMLISFIPLLLGAYYFIKYSYYFEQKRSNILNRYSYDKSNFFQRKKDEIILALISGLIGAVLGIIGTMLTQRK